MKDDKQEKNNVTRFIEVRNGPIFRCLQETETFSTINFTLRRSFLLARCKMAALFSPGFNPRLTLSGSQSFGTFLGN